MTDRVGTTTSAREFTITRVFAAARDVVFKAWTDPEQVARWWGPHGFTTPLSSISMDVRPGGVWRACLVRDADGSEHPIGGVYREVVEPERLVFTWGDPADPRGPDEASVVTITLTDRGGATEMTFHQAGFTTDEERADVHDGWSSCIDRLGAHVTRD